MAAAASSGRVAVHWFRKGLRLHDNPALLAACSAATTVYPGTEWSGGGCSLASCRTAGRISWIDALLWL
jgi:hypothetical protein